MADPLLKLFGRPIFSGTGRVGDYFPSAPDLSYLRDFQRPNYVPEDAGYDPSLNFENLIAEGYSEQDAAEIQDIRAGLHAQRQRDSILRDSRMAGDELSKIDPSRESLAKDILGIFNKYPNAEKDPSFLQKVDRIGALSRMMPQKVEEKIFDPDSIEDPDLYKQAIDEGWDKLPEKQGKRRLFDAATRKERRLKLIGMGMTRDEIDALEKKGGFSEEVLAEIQAKAKARPERTLQPEAAKHLAELYANAEEERARLLSDEGKLEYLRRKYSPNNPEKKDFSADQWNEAHAFAQQPNRYERQAMIYQQALGMIPSQASEFSPAATTNEPSVEPVQSTESLTVTAPNGKRYSFPTKEKADAFRKSIGQ